MVVLGSSLFLADVTAAYTRQLQKLHLVLVNGVTAEVDWGARTLPVFRQTRHYRVS
jgi:hypothetical protein